MDFWRQDSLLVLLSSHAAQDGLRLLLTLSDIEVNLQRVAE